MGKNGWGEERGKNGVGVNGKEANREDRSVM